MQIADAIPLRGMPTEIALRCCGALRPHGGKPLAVPRERHVGDIEARNEDAGKLGRAARSASRKNAQAPSRKRSTRPACMRAQMARNAGLRLPQNRCELGDR